MRQVRPPATTEITVDETKYVNYQEEYKAAVLAAIEKERLSHEQHYHENER